MARWDERPHSWDIDERYRGGLGMALALQGSGVANIDVASVKFALVTMVIIHCILGLLIWAWGLIPY